MPSLALAPTRQRLRALHRQATIKARRLPSSTPPPSMMIWCGQLPGCIMRQVSCSSLSYQPVLGMLFVGILASCLLLIATLTVGPYPNPKLKTSVPPRGNHVVNHMIFKCGIPDLTITPQSYPKKCKYHWPVRKQLVSTQSRMNSDCTATFCRQCFLPDRCSKLLHSAPEYRGWQRPLPSHRLEQHVLGLKCPACKPDWNCRISWCCAGKPPTPHPSREWIPPNGTMPFFIHPFSSTI